MECTPKSIAREKCSRCFMVELLVAPTKSSTNTSTRLTYDAAADRRCHAVSLALSSILSSNLCSGRVTSCKRDSMTSRAVSESAQKNGGDSHYPICKQFGTTIFISSISMLGSSDGRT